MKQKKNMNNNILMILDLLTGFWVFITRDMILQFPLLKKAIFFGIPIILGSYFIIYVLRRISKFRLKIYLEKLCQISILLFSVNILLVSLRYYFFPPEIIMYSNNDIQKYGGDLHKFPILICAYHEKTLYPQAQCYLNNNNELITYLDLNLNNLTDQSIDIKKIKLNIKDYQKANPFRFQINRVIGGDGEIKDHIYFGELISNKEENYLTYCGDEDQWDVLNNPNYNFKPSGLHVKLLPNDWDYFFLAFKFDQSGIYKFSYEIEYMINGEIKSEESKIFSWYMPSVVDYLDNDIQNIYQFDLESISPEEAYLVENIEDIFDNDKQSSKQVQNAVESLISK